MSCSDIYWTKAMLPYRDWLRVNGYKRAPRKIKKRHINNQIRHFKKILVVKLGSNVVREDPGAPLAMF